MKPETVKLQQLLDAVETLRREVGELSQRIATLEAAAAPDRSPAASSSAVSSPAPPSSQASTDADRLSEELVVTISAAIAAYLGVKPHIRQIRLLGSASWAQQGRASIQASHSLAVQMERRPS